MKTENFTQTSSISKKLGSAILVVIVLFVLQFVGVYLAAQRILSGFSNLHRQQQISDLVTEIHQITDSLSGVLQQGGRGIDSERVFMGIADRAVLRLSEARAISAAYPDYLDYVGRIEVSLNNMRAAGKRFYGLAPSTERERQLALGRQFGLDTTEGEEQLKLLIQNHSNFLFEGLYRARYQPIIVNVSLTLLFVIFSLAVGTAFARKLSASVHALIDVTKEVSSGNLEARARNFAKDEIGMLANSFNLMVRDLQQSTFSREYVEAVIQSLPDSLFVVSPWGAIQRVNRTAVKTTEDDSEDLLNRSIRTLFVPDPPELLEELRDYECSLVSKSGRLVPVSVSSSSIQGKGGKVSGMVYVVKDLSERKELEAEKLRIAEIQQILVEASNILAESIDFETTLEHVLQVIVPKLGDCCFLHVNGKEGEKDRVKSVCARPEFDARIRAYSENVIKSKHSLVVESVSDAGQTELGELGVNSYVVCPLVYRGESLGSLAVLSTHANRRYNSRDLLDFEELARRAAIAIENSKLYYEAQEAILSRDEFLSIASHELRTPLTALQLQLQIFAREISRNFDSREGAATRSEEKHAFMTRALTVVKSCESQSRKLTNLLDELLDLTRIRLGKLQLSKELVDLSEVVKTVVEQFRVEFLQKGIQISVDVPKSVKSFLDPMRVEQIVSNLISNALKYGGGSPIHVSLESDVGTGRAKLVVSDQGVGIQPQMRDRIFERFERAGVSGKKIAGLGLGLYICRQIVEAHGGTIRVESSVGHGSSFIVDLPMTLAHDLSEEQSKGA